MNNEEPKKPVTEQPVTEKKPQEQSAPQSPAEDTVTPKQPLPTFTLTKTELINVLEYCETLAMIDIQSSKHPGMAWAGGKLLDKLTEAKHWVYEMQTLPPMPDQSAILTPKDFLKKK